MYQRLFSIANSYSSPTCILNWRHIVKKKPNLATFQAQAVRFYRCEAFTLSIQVAACSTFVYIIYYGHYYYNIYIYIHIFFQSHPSARRGVSKLPNYLFYHDSRETLPALWIISSSPFHPHQSYRYIILYHMYTISLNRPSRTHESSTFSFPRARPIPPNASRVPRSIRDDFFSFISFPFCFL